MIKSTRICLYLKFTDQSCVNKLNISEKLQSLASSLESDSSCIHYNYSHGQYFEFINENFDYPLYMSIGADEITVNLRIEDIINASKLINFLYNFNLRYHNHRFTDNPLNGIQ